jgi:hypothetical protein
MAFAETNGQYNGNTYNASITVTITDPGTNCPPNGEVRSEWKWSKGTYEYSWRDGTTVLYSGPFPWTGQVTSIHPGGPYLNPIEAAVQVIPTGHPEAHNAAIVYPPFNPITLNPGTCDEVTISPQKPATPY